MKQISELLEHAGFHPILITPVSGGDINQAFLIQENERNLFLKCNNASAYPNMMRKEACGLDALRNASSFVVPEVVQVGAYESLQFLILECIETAPPTPACMAEAGRQLALQHQQPRAFFGWEDDNYIGSLAQPNTPSEKWDAFYASFRIMPMIRTLYDKGSLKRNEIGLAETLCARIASFFPEEPPALLHGDLWSGNFMATVNERPVLIDPAVYSGHREMDIGMTLLFGGFTPEFYRAYESVFPLEMEWKERIPLTQLYPLLVHAVLFGSSYVQRVRTILEKFGA